MLNSIKIQNTVSAAIVVIALAFGCTGCKNDAPAQAAAPTSRPVQVEVEQVKTILSYETAELPGRISARRIAQVRARVAGIILSRDFTEGSHVEKGQPLFHIDPAMYQASLAQAKADLAKAETSMIDLKTTSDRYAKLIKTKSISQQEYDTALNNYKAAVATRNAAEAAVRSMDLNLSYATVTAPISGRIGKALVTEGALVGKNEATHLATIQQLDPIYADINQPVSEYLRFKANMNEAMRSKGKADVELSLENVDYTTKGKLLFSDVTVDQETGQVSLRCEFPNTDGMLLPGMFVRIKIELGEGMEAIFVPQKAVTIGGDGSAQVFVVDAQNIVHSRQVKTGRMQGGLWQIKDGLIIGEQLVISGVDKVRDGMTVNVKKPENTPVAMAGTVQTKP
ncbi:efflux RND transporter periplasmic adaptor subunit [Maridesulfovibrio sp. FT414]|uniref:efflux RND transporter periplasmic adaptor subunit n=1 Tax=Maridesulfovibrio sp. FT414 TaxID=2979469 RepID=UPI003D800B20